ncbi:hypothetical protein H0H92_001836 [Tricholoma furcatifolium]|nr:hypothetical protein H0H92_001836 [Tricholoma furcatifolium]
MAAEYQVKLLQALRNGDPVLIHAFLAEIAKEKENSSELGAAALHLAIRCASPNTVALLLTHRAISPNGVHPPGSGTTPLHLAASLGRVEIVQMLLEQEGINDALRDAYGKSVKDVARGKDVIKVIHGELFDYLLIAILIVISDSHTFLNASFRSLLHAYIHSPPAASPPSALLNLLASPRTRFIDLSYLDDSSGLALLHEAARRRDLRLIELTVRAGADIFVRDRKGRLPGEGIGAPKDDRVRVFLRQFANHDSTLLADQDPEPPTMKGYLNKYTNVAKGYNTRWFVLKNGVLSYYRHQSDESIASRGSLTLKTATLKIPLSSTQHASHLQPTSPSQTSSQIQSTSTTQTTTDRLRIEIHSSSSHGGQKWYLKANHPVEAARWAAALKRAQEWAHREDGEASSASAVTSVRRKSGESDRSLSLKNRAATLLRRGNGSFKRAPTPSEMSITSMDMGGRPEESAIEGKEAIVDDQENDADEDGDGDEEDEDSSMGSGGVRKPPHEDVYELQANALLAQMELTSQLATGLETSKSPSTSAFTSPTMSRSSLLTASTSGVITAPTSPVPSVSSSAFTTNAFYAHPQQVSTLLSAIQTAHNLLNEHLAMSRERDSWFRAQAVRAKRKQKVWEESMATVVRDGEGLERELRTRSRRRGSRFFDVDGYQGGEALGKGLESRGGTLRAKKSLLGALKEGDVEAVTPSVKQPPSATPEVKTPTLKTEAAVAPSITTPIPAPLATVVVPPGFLHVNEEEEGDTDDEDEFFDAIESGTLPGLVIPPTLSPSPIPLPVISSESLATLSAPAQKMLFPAPLSVLAAPYGAYQNLRSSLDLNEERPNTSLWSVLKHSIGKDLTKISFPVFFNEPTSMLQRMAEDMEFTECLDAAAKERDPLRRLAFVAAFAMSNYSSTIGRIAKPFNPMLSETFEYVRFDKEFRYYSEQVSHHPPISACWAEAPTWHYYGEVDAQNKFMGKSFEIRPTGIAHVDLILPAERCSKDYPAAPAKYGKDKVVEHYSWKKVTTNVSGFILGAPTIDHYGDMTVTNHRTGDCCVLTFKPRGWRGKDAFEIAGQVMDALGRVAYHIAGRWNSQLIASPANRTGTALNPDLNLDSSYSPPAHFLLWRNSEKRVGSPFNLTPFAITLNDCPKETLRPYLPPTDCRLRPDQRAFELGKWELANELKVDQEQKQRAIRKAREEGKRAPHQPRWFIAETDGDTGDRVWAPIRTEEGEGEVEYWVERERVYEELREGGKAHWKDVDDIFIATPSSVER